MLKIDSVFSGQWTKGGANLQRVRCKAVKEAIFYRLFFRPNDDNLLVVARLSKTYYKLQQLVISEKSFDQLDNKGQQQAENNHGSDWKIEPEIFFLYTYIARQAANPVEFIVKKINDHAGNYDKNANDNDPFSGIAVHDAKIKLYRAFPVKKSSLKKERHP